MAPDTTPEPLPDETVSVNTVSYSHSTTAGKFDPEKAARFVADLFMAEVQKMKKRGPNFTPSKRKKRRRK